MQRLGIGLGLVVSIAVACSGKSKSNDDSAASSGGAVATGGRDTGGSDNGGSDASAGRTTTGGQAVSSGGNSSMPEAGAPASTGGQAATGGSTSEPGGGSGGDNSAQGGGGAEGGAPPGSDCDCGPLEECFDGRAGQLCVARSVLVPLGFTIDATEVTRAQYAAWLAVRPEEPRQSPQCEWNEDFEPDAGCMAQASVCQGADCGDHPQPCLDFCDAAAYCRDIGKQLCGGVDGGSTDAAGADSEWLLTCTANGKNRAISGDSFLSGQCNDQTTSATTTVPVASKTDCQSPEPGYSGVFDLIGNLREWDDNCDTMSGRVDICHLRGGGFGISAAAPFCNETVYAERGDFAETVGFRCCNPRPDRP
jgi:hypothetical protein